MKRIITFIIAIALLLGVSFVVGAGTTYAAPSKTACYKYNGKAVTKKFTDSGCAKSDGGSCKISKKKISCTKPSADPDDTSTPAGADCGTGGADCASDPALTCKKDNCDIVDNYVNPAITALSILVGLAVTIGIIWGGIEVSMSAGDPQKSASGKNHIRNAIIALVAYIFLYAFLRWVVPTGIA